LAVVAALVALGAAPAGAQVQPYQANDGRGFRNILPPGQNGLINAPQLATFVAAGAQPPNSDNQLRMGSCPELETRSASLVV
jgi:hypothetical protein